MGQGFVEFGQTKKRGALIAQNFGIKISSHAQNCVHIDSLDF